MCYVLVTYTCCIRESQEKHPKNLLISPDRKGGTKMARYTGPNNKQARRVSFSILENGKDLKRPFGPGQHGKDRKSI